MSIYFLFVLLSALYNRKKLKLVQLEMAFDPLAARSFIGKIHFVS